MSVAPGGEEPAKSKLGKLIEFSKQINAVGAIIVTLIGAVTGYSLGVRNAKKELTEELATTKKELEEKYDPKLADNEKTISLLKKEAGRIRTYIQLEQAIAEARFRVRCDRMSYTYDRNSRICFPKDEDKQPERLPWLDEKDPFTIGDETQPKDGK